MAKSPRAEPGKNPPEARIRARNKARILRAAVGLFAAKGFDGTHVTEIAELSDLPKANIYYYFSTKESIYNTLIEQLIGGWDKAFDHIVADSAPREAISAYVRAKLDYSRKHAEESRFFANEILRGAHFLTRRHRQHMRKVTQEKANVIETWIGEKKMATVDPYHFFIMLWSATQFYANFEPLVASALQKRTMTKRDYDVAAKTITRIVLDGCAKPG